MLFNNTQLVAATAEVTWRESLLSGATNTEFNSMNRGESQNTSYHIPVLLDEVLAAMAPKEGQVIVDGTLGGGGHTEAMLNAGAQIIGVDQDDQALAYAKDRLAGFGDNFKLCKGNFSQLPTLLNEIGQGQVDGILVDIGVSSWQLDEAERGFSFGKEGPLDMRMDRSNGRTAADLVNHAPEEELRSYFWEYGEERAGRKIAQRIVERRAEKEFVTTTDLADFISSILPRGGKSHPATRVFQALRIAVNDELGVLRSLLENAAGLLKPGGRLLVITFHSLEDRMVKQFFKNGSTTHIDRKEWPEPRPNPDFQYRLISRKAITATDEEISRNKRSRTAKLRVVEKIS